MVAQPFEDSVTGPAGWQQVAGRGKVLQKAVYALNQLLIYSADFANFSDSWDPQVHNSRSGKIGVVPLTINSS